MNWEAFRNTMLWGLGAGLAALGLLALASGFVAKRRRTAAGMLCAILVGALIAGLVAGVGVRIMWGGG